MTDYQQLPALSEAVDSGESMTEMLQGVLISIYQCFICFLLRNMSSRKFPKRYFYRDVAKPPRNVMELLPKLG